MIMARLEIAAPALASAAGIALPGLERNDVEFVGRSGWPQRRVAISSRARNAGKTP